MLDSQPFFFNSFHIASLVIQSFSIQSSAVILPLISVFDRFNLRMLIITPLRPPKKYSHLASSSQSDMKLLEYYPRIDMFSYLQIQHSKFYQPDMTVWSLQRAAIRQLFSSVSDCTFELYPSLQQHLTQHVPHHMNLLLISTFRCHHPIQLPKFSSKIRIEIHSFYSFQKVNKYFLLLKRANTKYAVVFSICETSTNF